MKCKVLFGIVWVLAHNPRSACWSCIWLQQGQEQIYFDILKPICQEVSQVFCSGSSQNKVLIVLLVSFLQPFMSPRYPGGPRPSLRMPNQPPGSIPGSQPLLPNSLDPTRPQGIDKTCGVISERLHFAEQCHSGFWKRAFSPHLWDSYWSKQCCCSNKLHSACFTTGHPNMGGPMRMNPPRGMGGMGPQVGAGFITQTVTQNEA